MKEILLKKTINNLNNIKKDKSYRFTEKSVIEWLCFLKGSACIKTKYLMQVGTNFTYTQ